MLDLKQYVKKEGKIKVEPSNDIFKELGNNNYDFIELISELIDNSIAAKVEDELLKVEIEIGISDNSQESYLVIKDNGMGIKTENLGRAITPAGYSGGKTLNEHGLGMKQAVASLGTLKYLLTRSIDESYTNHISEFAFGEVSLFQIDYDWEHGTEICVTGLNGIVPTKQQKYTMYVVPYLGAKYRRFLKSDNPKMRLSVKLFDMDQIDEKGNPTEIQSWKVREVKQIYFHPNKRVNQPILHNKEFKGKGWKAKFTFGYAPNDLEYDELGLEVPKAYFPYAVSIKKQGFDIISHDRVINFSQFHELDFINIPHNNYNYVRGEIDLYHGFSTSTTKNFIIKDENFEDLLTQIKVYLEEKGLLERKNDPEELPEKLLRDRLARNFKSRAIDPKKDVKTEYTIQGLAGAIDVLADGEAWELKKGQAAGLDVYQLFAYMDMGNINKGYLVARSFSTGAQSAADFIKKNHLKEIILVKLDEFPILYAPDADERKKYFR
ncbi:ATP-binding protein [Exiguobacterium sp. AT1b]|uniref:ATP-binding protein n=1 Tax=Exiguobacterium sp. (strain ATCC BAA-1283 / AT1b) TaxID=360911 RepID=UPI0009FA3A97|nr:ATP-binding protein [Exiguobacterium sp. AT1b]